MYNIFLSHKIRYTILYNIIILSYKCDDIKHFFYNNQGNIHILFYLCYLLLDKLLGIYIYFIENLNK